MAVGAGSFVGSLLGGFNQATSDMRTRNQHEADLQAERDNKIFDALANSDDPDIRAAAVTGLLTGNHPARAFDKFMGKVGTHPAYEQIKGLVANGHQPFMDPTERVKRNAAAGIEGRLTGANQGVKEVSGQDLPYEDVSRMAMGMAGAAPRTVAPYTMTAVVQDGEGKRSTVGAEFRDGQEYHAQTGQPLREWANANGMTILGTSRTGNTNQLMGVAPGGRSAGAVHMQEAAKQFLQRHPELATHPAMQGVSGDQVVRYQQTPQGELVPNSFAVGPPAQSTFAPFAAGNSVYAFGTRGPAAGTMEPAKGGVGLGRAEPPTASVEYLQRELHDILAQAKSEAPPLVQGVNLPEDTAKQKAAADAVAKRHGFPGGVADLERKIREAGGQIEAATPGSGAPPAAPPGAAPAAQPTAPGAAPTPAKAPASTVKGTDPIVDAVLRELGIGTPKKPGG